MKSRVCLGCEEREVGCHATCPRFLRESEEREKWKEEHRRKLQCDHDLMSITLRRLAMWRKGRWNKE